MDTLAQHLFKTVNMDTEGCGADWHPVVDVDLAARWKALEALDEGTLGRAVADFYVARGFSYPGEPESVSPFLAKHDWVHVLADYGTCVSSELEVFAFIAAAGANSCGWGMFTVVLRLFETGSLNEALGVFTSDPGHMDGPDMALRISDAMRRGSECHRDLLATDWFLYADWDVDAVRFRFNIPSKRIQSPGPWDPEGITESQMRAAVEMAAGK